ncbi:MAG: FHA domain-containing protein [Desulfobacteraceae bacterium]|nr:FHA domain-containing protein [Desulfobacteraceae bacterium]
MKPLEINLVLTWGAGLTITISLVGLGIIYRRQLMDFIKNNFEKIRFKLGPGEIELDIRRLEEARGRVDIPPIPESRQGMDSKQASREEPDLSERDIVLNKWGGLKQIVNDAAIGRKGRFPTGSKVQDVVKWLVGANLITVDLSDAITILFEEGKRVMDDSCKVDREYAFMYEEIADAVVDWMMLNVLSPEEEQRRETVVGEMDAGVFFPTPRPGEPIAWLVGKSEKLQGDRFIIDKALYRIGRDPDNDLCLNEDDYASGGHARFKFVENNLFLYDLNSRNGTFVNGRRISGTPCAVRKGDKIKFGSSVFEVA